jgi:hypothetical protein
MQGPEPCGNIMLQVTRLVGSVSELLHIHENTTRCEIRKLETRDTSDLEGGGLGNLDVMKEPSFTDKLSRIF